MEGTNVFVEVVDGEGVPVSGVTVTVTGGEYDGQEFEIGPGGRAILQDVDSSEYVLAATIEESEDECTLSVLASVDRGEGDESA